MQISECSGFPAILKPLGENELKQIFECSDIPAILKPLGKNEMKQISFPEEEFFETSSDLG